MEEIVSHLCLVLQMGYLFTAIYLNYCCVSERWSSFDLSLLLFVRSLKSIGKHSSFKCTQAWKIKIAKQMFEFFFGHKEVPLYQMNGINLLYLAIVQNKS